ncbi:hypothetical protein CTZ28_14915 [Streptomyces shenzhenensis]|uniref:Uncharacterized protein n=1 Tax=Streptomyces shenzhenensis TaxID=943815 RepID=A0A3M0I9B8_9ACTN|nr:hypothetical protein CTZ28_14915 [Streptomyces shenzhenensis]
MDGVPERIDPSTDRVAAAILLRCSPDELGYCPRCQGLTHRYGRDAQVLCPACAAGAVWSPARGDSVSSPDERDQAHHSRVAINSSTSASVNP